jgi:hypothetical protein
VGRLPVTRGPVLVIAAVAALVILLAPETGFAAGRSVKLEVVRSAEASDCPDAPALGAAIARVMAPEPLDLDPAGPPTLAFDVSFTRSASRYTATVTTSGAHARQRTIEDNGSTCSALTEAVAVTVVIILDGVAAGQAAVESPAPDAPVAPALTAPTAAGPAPTRPPAPSAPSPPRQPPRPSARPRTRRPPGIARSVVFLEAFGNGLSYSFNYEYRFFDDGAVSLRAGFGGLPADFPLRTLSPGSAALQGITDVLVAWPVLANYSIGRGALQVEIGAGITPIYSEVARTASVVGTALVAYRYIPREGGFNFGVGFTPLFDATVFLPWGGVTLGMGF